MKKTNLGVKAPEVQENLITPSLRPVSVKPIRSMSKKVTGLKPKSRRRSLAKWLNKGI